MESVDEPLEVAPVVPWVAACARPLPRISESAASVGTKGLLMCIADAFLVVCKAASGRR